MRATSPAFATLTGGPTPVANPGKNATVTKMQELLSDLVEEVGGEIDVVIDASHFGKQTVKLRWNDRELSYTGPHLDDAHQQAWNDMISFGVTSDNLKEFFPS
jgi:hypothetical protein